MTKNKAYLFTDGRYFLQAEQQLDEYVEITLLSIQLLIATKGTGL